MKKRKAKIKWQCRRGMLELDLLLNGFIDKHLDKLTEAQVATFEQLLSANDVDLYTWLMGSGSPNDKELASFVKYIQLQD